MNYIHQYKFCPRYRDQSNHVLFIGCFGHDSMDKILHDVQLQKLLELMLDNLMLFTGQGACGNCWGTGLISSDGRVRTVLSTPPTSVDDLKVKRHDYWHCPFRKLYYGAQCWMIETFSGRINYHGIQCAWESRPGTRVAKLEAARRATSAEGRKLWHRESSPSSPPNEMSSHRMFERVLPQS